MPDEEVTEEATKARFITPKVAKGLSVTGKGIVGLSIPAIITALITMLPGIYSDIKEQRKEQEDGYKTLAPTVLDLQGSAEEFQTFSEGVAEHHTKQQRTISRLKKKNWKLEQRIYQIELALRARRINVQPVAPEEGDDPPNLVSLIEDNPAPLRAPKAKPKRPVPQSINAAKHYQEQRVQMKCPPGDPLCGAD